MRKSILFVIDSLTIGGAEKSLVSLINLIDTTKYEIDLLMIRRGGDLERFVPDYVTILPEPGYFKSIENDLNLNYQYYRYKTSIKLRVNKYKRKALHTEQVVYGSIEKIIRPLEKRYDLAVAYSQGMPTYFVANKVDAEKKAAWINTDYVNTRYDKDYDYQSYCKIDKMVAVSNHVVNSVANLRKEYTNKIDQILDIVDPTFIEKMANEGIVKEHDKNVVNILTVGRLVEAKGYEKAIQVARLLKKSEYKFKWLVIGEGPEKNKYQKLIEENQLENHFILLGKKINPYIYMKMCDLYVQTSLKEGYGLTVSEAKILKKPIVCTNFPTAKEIIHSEIDGLIVEHDIESIFEGITKFLNEKTFKEKIIKQLNSMAAYSSVNQLEKFYSLIEK